MAQSIVWKYETPLQGKYLAAGFYGGISPGLAEPVTAAFNGADSILLQPYQVYVQPLDATTLLPAELIVKIYEDSQVTLSGLTENVAAVGLSYIWEEDSSREAEYEYLTASQVEGYAGVILFMVDVAALRVYTLSADFCDSYLMQVGQPGYFLRWVYPRDEGVSFSPTKFLFAPLFGDSSAYRLSVQYTNTDTSEVSLFMVEPGREMDFAGQAADRYYLVGFVTLVYGTEDSPVLPDISLQVISSSEEASSLSCGLTYTPVAVVYWSGDVFSSGVYPVQFGSSGQTYVAPAEFGAEATSIEVREYTEADLERVTVYPKQISQESRVSILDPWSPNTRITKRQVSSWFHTASSSPLYVGQGTRNQADVFRGSVGFCFYAPDRYSGVVRYFHCDRQDDEAAGLLDSFGEYSELFSGGDKEFLQAGDTVGGVEVGSPVAELFPDWEDDVRVLLVTGSSSVAAYQADLSSARSRVFGAFVMKLEETERDTFLTVRFADGHYFELGESGWNLRYWEAFVPDEAVSSEVEMLDSEIRYVEGPGVFYVVRDESIYNIKLFDSGLLKYPVRFYVANYTGHYVYLEYGHPTHEGVDLPPDTVAAVEFLGELSYGLWDWEVDYSEATEAYPVPYMEAEELRAAGSLYDGSGVLLREQAFGFDIEAGRWYQAAVAVRYGSAGEGDIAFRFGDFVLSLDDTLLSVSSYIEGYEVNSSGGRALFKEFYEAGLSDSAGNLIGWSGDIGYPMAFLREEDRYFSLQWDEGMRTNLFESDPFKEAFGIYRALVYVGEGSEYTVPLDEFAGFEYSSSGVYSAAAYPVSQERTFLALTARVSESGVTVYPKYLEAGQIVDGIGQIGVKFGSGLFGELIFNQEDPSGRVPVIVYIYVGAA